MATRRLATVLSIDVVGYSKMMQADASGTLSALNSVFRSLVRPRVAANEGRIVKLLGDGALVEFQSAYQALVCAVSIQEQLRDAGPSHDSNEDSILLRMGLHVGDVLVEGEDIFGDGVNTAARLQAAAEVGGVLLSRMVADLAGGDLPCRLRPEGMRSFKNIERSIEVLSVDFSDERELAERASVAVSQEIRFCQAKDGVRLAWAEGGKGPPLLKAPNWIGHLELDWRHPVVAHLYSSLMKRYRLVRFDARANGLSDWEVADISFDLFVDDLEAVFDESGIERSALLAISQGGAVAAAFAARAPERVSAIVMIGSYPVGRALRQSKKVRDRARALKEMMTAGWDDDYPSLRDLMADIIVPGASLEDRLQYARDMKDMITPENMGRYRDVIDHVDVTDLLSQVQAPTLVIHCKGDRLQPIEQGRKMAAGISKARFVAYESNNHLPMENDSCWPLVEQEIHAFLKAHV